jgi:flagellin-specific chaperone FliS
MNYKDELEELYNRSLLKVEHFINKNHANEEIEKLYRLKDELEQAWTKLMEHLFIPERIEA